MQIQVVQVHSKWEILKSEKMRQWLLNWNSCFKDRRIYIFLYKRPEDDSFTIKGYTHVK